MAISRLELASAHGDQTLASLRFVVYGSNAVTADEVLRHGLSFVEGRAIVSTDAIQAYENATDFTGTEGVVTVIAMPKEFHIGYAVFTTAYIDRSLKIVMGAPLRYASSRKQLAFYLNEDTEAARKRIEAEAVGGFPVANHATFRVEPRNIIGTFKTSSSFKNVITQLAVSAKALDPIDFNVVEASLSSLFVVREAAQAVLVPSMVRDMVLGTVESAILTRARILRWQGLALLGYRFREGREDVVVAKPRDAEEHRHKMDEFGRLLASSRILDGELAWLKTYVTQQLELMRVELDGAELE